MSPVIPEARVEGDEAAVVTKAVIRAARLLDLSNKVLAKTLGLSEATVSRMKREGYSLQKDHKSFELAVLLIRLYRSLDAIVGGEDAIAQRWLRNENRALGERPIILIESITGLLNVIAYLDARRAIV